jgi:hypothetical protein
MKTLHPVTGQQSAYEPATPGESRSSLTRREALGAAVAVAAAVVLGPAVAAAAQGAEIPAPPAPEPAPPLRMVCGCLLHPADETPNPPPSWAPQGDYWREEGPYCRGVRFRWVRAGTDLAGEHRGEATMGLRD